MKERSPRLNCKFAQSNQSMFKSVLWKLIIIHLFNGRLCLKFERSNLREVLVLHVTVIGESKSRGNTKSEVPRQAQFINKNERINIPAKAAPQK